MAYLVLFAGTAFVFVFAALTIGRLLRPRVPTPTKQEIYECGEPTIGSGFVQFDLRFYVVALLFLVLDVEAAFFFPWAVVYGASTRLSDPAIATKTAAALLTAETGNSAASTTVDERHLAALGVSRRDVPIPRGSFEENARLLQASFRDLASMGLTDIAVFFGVLLVGFAYIWKQGDLDWVRATVRPAAEGQSHPDPHGAVP
ncbi:MAG: NADH-quinone oxidoreductase subunit A [Thermoguttaceae bacterium]|nr:NADH-quinone oxidoreductase subunit A [Thermoguttaceae bacterium]